MGTRMFPTAVLRELTWGELPEGYALLVDEQTGSGRWSSYHRMVFAFEGKLWETTYSRGLTESQDERPYEYDGEEVDCVEVEARPKTVTEYVPVSD